MSEKLSLHLADGLLSVAALVLIFAFSLSFFALKPKQLILSATWKEKWQI